MRVQEHSISFKVGIYTLERASSRVGMEDGAPVRSPSYSRSWAGTERVSKHQARPILCKACIRVVLRSGFDVRFATANGA